MNGGHILGAQNAQANAATLNLGNTLNAIKGEVEQVNMNVARVTFNVPVPMPPPPLGLPEVKLTRVALTMAGGEWNSGPIVLDGTNIANSGVFDININTDTVMSAVGGVPSNFYNLAGATFKKNTGFGVTSIFAAFENAGNVFLQGRLMRFGGNITQTGGVFDLDGGELDLLLFGLGQGTFHLQGGTLGKRGRIIGGSVNQSGGILEVGGNLSISGNYTQGAGTFQVNAIANNTFGQLQVGGTATLGGPLTVSLGTFNVAQGTTAKIVTASTRVNTFSPIPNGWKTTEDNTSVTLEKL